MNLLEESREKIDAIDAQMAVLWQQRMEAVAGVVRYKAQTGKPVLDSSREEIVIAKNTARITEPALRDYYAELLRCEMALSRQYQTCVLGRDTVAYQGVEGAFSHIALTRLFPRARAQSFASWDEVFAAVESGAAAYGVLPFENSHAGDVSAVLDLCYGHPEIWVVDLYDLPVQQNLLGLPGTDLRDIQKVVSHPQAISQSEKFLRSNRLEAAPFPNTAAAAQYVAQQGDRSLAAIASSETARLYGLEVLVENINTDGDNTTRFIVISREKPTTGNRFSVLFTVENTPGSLARVVQAVASAGLNMECIKSRPRPHVPFEYYFYAELAGTGADPQADCAAALELLRPVCQELRLLGMYRR